MKVYISFQQFLVQLQTLVVLGPFCFKCAMSSNSTSIMPTSTTWNSPTSEPSFKLSSKKCFTTRDELRQATIEYCKGNVTVRAIYGDPIGTWCVDAITDFSCLFNDDPRLESDYCSWNPWADTFNEDISMWNTSSATEMYAMFYKAYQFNQDISRWDVSSVTNMERMFGYASSFNQDISSWNVSSAKVMWRMFEAASAFNQDISSWNVSSATRVTLMFYGAGSFNQDLCVWGTKLPPAAETDLMFLGSGCRVKSSPRRRESFPLTLLPWGPFCHRCLFSRL